MEKEGTLLTKRMPLMACSRAVIATTTCRTTRVMIVDELVDERWKYEPGSVCQRSEGCKEQERAAYGREGWARKRGEESVRGKGWFRV
jgi:hypothetical protein